MADMKTKTADTTCYRIHADTMREDAPPGRWEDTAAKLLRLAADQIDQMNQKMTERDLDRNPYTPDERRVVNFLWDRGMGGGDDPIGFLLASYQYVVAKRNRLTEELKTANDIIEGT